MGEAILAEEDLRRPLLPCPPPQISFGMSLSMLLSTWRASNPANLDKAVDSFPNACLLAVLQQDPRHGDFVMSRLVQSGTAGRQCGASLASAAKTVLGNPQEGNVRRDAFTALLGECLAASARGVDSSASFAVCSAIARCIGPPSCSSSSSSSSSSPPRKGAGRGSGGADGDDCSAPSVDREAIDVISEGIKIAKNLLGREHMPPIPLEPLMRLLVVDFFKLLACPPVPGKHGDVGIGDGAGRAMAVSGGLGAWHVLQALEAEGAVCSSADLQAVHALVKLLCNMCSAVQEGTPSSSSPSWSVASLAIAEANKTLAKLGELESKSAKTTPSPSLWRCLCSEQVYSAYLGCAILFSHPHPHPLRTEPTLCIFWTTLPTPRRLNMRLFPNQWLSGLSLLRPAATRLQPASQSSTVRCASRCHPINVAVAPCLCRPGASPRSAVIGVLCPCLELKSGKKEGEGYWNAAAAIERMALCVAMSESCVSSRGWLAFTPPRILLITLSTGACSDDRLFADCSGGLMWGAR
jgi:hypothetical protein